MLKIFGFPALTIAAFLLASSASAQSQRTVFILEGDVTRELGPAVANWLADHSDETIGLNIQIDPTPNAAPDGSYEVFGEPDQSRISLSAVDRELHSGVEINADAVWSRGAWQLEGFFVPTSSGMGQGIAAYYLQPVDASSVPLTANWIHIQTNALALHSIPVGSQDQEIQVLFYESERNAIEVTSSAEGTVIGFYPIDGEGGDCSTARSFCPQLDVNVGYLYNGGPVRDVDNKCTFNVRSIVLNGLQTLRVRVNSYCARDFGRDYNGDYAYAGEGMEGQE